MKYYSEQTKEFYNSVEECEGAEKALADKIAAEAKAKAEKDATRKARAKEVEDAMKAVVDARKHYDELLKAFCKDYGSYHCTIDPKNYNLFDDFKSMFWF